MITSISSSPLLFAGYKHGLLLHNSLCRQVPFFYTKSSLILYWNEGAAWSVQLRSLSHHMGLTPGELSIPSAGGGSEILNLTPILTLLALCFHSVTEVLTQFLTAARLTHLDWYRNPVLCVRPNYLKCFTAHPKVSDHVNQRWGLGTCILMYVKSPIDILVQYLHESAVFWGPHMEKHLKASWRA